MSIPRSLTRSAAIEVRTIDSIEQASGRGRVLRCRRRDCGAFNDVIEHAT